jgi:hypothetical protein
MISQRIKAALAAAEARGVVLGNPSLATAREHAVKARVAGADRRATRGRLEPGAIDRQHDQEVHPWQGQGGLQAA